ncbi:MAG: hypothetical protein RLY70_1527 [Planctomycetota bacterium]
MTQRVLLGSLVATLVLAMLAAGQGWAAVPSDQLLPATTKGYLAVPNLEELTKKFDESQLGQLCNDPLMKPFADDLKRQLNEKLTDAGRSLGISIDDLSKIVGGEVAFALIQPDNDPTQAARVVYADTTGKTAETTAVMERIAKNQIAKGAKRTAIKVGAIELMVLVRPKPKATKPAAKDAAKDAVVESLETFYLLHDNQFVAVDHRKTALELAGRLQSPAGQTLGSIKPFQVIMEKSGKSAGGVAPHLRWFCEPFGYATANRVLQGGRRRRGPDLLKVLGNQGFKAIQGLGGLATFSTGSHELLHRTFIYAPAVPNAEPGQKYLLAARMLNFPNGGALQPLPWIPAQLSNHISFNAKIKEGFEYVGTLVNEYANEPGVFEDVLNSIRDDVHGPRVDLRKELVAHAAERVTIVTDNWRPVSTKSERLMVAIEATRPDLVAKTIDKIMESDPDAQKHIIAGHTVWEVVNDDADMQVEAIVIEGSDSPTPVSSDDKDKDAEPSQPLITSAALTVVNGHLVFANNLDFLRALLTRTKPASLAESTDFVAVTKALTDLGSDQDSFRLFTRTHEAYRVNYEMMRRGEMPESESITGKLLNRMLTTESDDDGRSQQIDGSKLPQFETMEKYLGPAGAFVESVDDGWLMVGCLLKKTATAK